MPHVKSNKVCFTLNNWTQEEVDALTNYLDNSIEAISFAIVGQEIGQSGTAHLQGYIRFKTEALKAKDGNLTFWRRVPGLERAHFEGAKGSDEQSSEYCSKDGPFQTWGQPTGNVDPFKSILEFCKGGDIASAMDVDAELTIK